MSFTARLSADLVAVEAGATVPFTIEIVNRGEEQDRFEMEVEGLDPEWTAVPVPSFAAEPGETHPEKIFFKPPRASESLSGNYPFVVKVRSLISGESRTVQGVMQIKPYHHLSMEISPKKGYITPTVKHNDFTVTLINLGNTEQTLQLFGNDPEDECAFEFEHDQVSLGPGQQREVEVHVNPTSTRFMASSRLYGFVVSARSMDHPSVAVSAQAQLEHRPFVTPWRLVFLFTLGIVAALWIYFAPKPPVIHLDADKEDALVGETITVHWSAQNANRVVIKVGDRVLEDTPSLNGSVEYTPSSAGTVEFDGQAMRDNKASPPESLAVGVTAPVPAPSPVIEEFRVDKSSVKVGESVVLSYKFNEAVVKAILLPNGDPLDPKLDQKQVTITASGKTTFKVVAENKDGATTSKSVSVNATQGSAASIVVFKPAQTSLKEPGPVTIYWQLTNAARAELQVGTEPLATIDPTSGSRDYLIDRTTVFTLTIYDDHGYTVTKAFKVTVPMPPPPQETSGNTAGEATAGDTAGQPNPGIGGRK